jgi:hypothetical protein
MAILPRATNKTRFETNDTPTQQHFEDLLDSVKFQVDDAGEGLRDHNPTIAYLLGQGVFDPATTTVYRAVADVPIGIALSNLSYWRPSVTSLRVIDAVNVDSPVELNAQTVAAGRVLFVREAGTPGRAMGATIYLHSDVELTQEIPFVMKSADTPTAGSWIAIAGRNGRGGNGVSLLDVVSIDNPSTALNARGVAQGALQLVRETGAFGKGATLYMWQSGTSLSVNAPYVIATSDTGRWIAIAGRYIHSASRTQRTTIGRVYHNPGLTGSQITCPDDAGFVTTTNTNPGTIHLPANPVDGQVLIVVCGAGQTLTAQGSHQIGTTSNWNAFFSTRAAKDTLNGGGNYLVFSQTNPTTGGTTGYWQLFYFGF